ncbi:MAG TPA: hypothetical protein VNK52_03245 [Hyphomicrobiaceae bacterium]|nr:hypothetical protein [Hyphomicrobiaceae bacterium]
MAFDYFAVTGFGFLMPFKLGEHVGAFQQKLGGSRPQLDRSVEAFERLFISIGQRQRPAQIEVSADGIGSGRNGSAEESKGILRFPELAANDAHQLERRWPVGSRLQYLQQRSARGQWLPAQQECLCPLEIVLQGLRRIELQRLLHVCTRLKRITA